MHQILSKKHTGLLIPLFSMSSKDDFGCGDVGSVKEWIDFLKELNIDILQILPINEIPPKTNCPYTALTAFAIDPIYISIKDIRFLSPKIKKEIESKEFKETIKTIKQKEFIDYDIIKTIKFKLLWEQYNYFRQNFILTNSNEKKEFDDYIEKNKYWLRDYAIFRRLKDVYNFSSWTSWQDEFKDPHSNYISKFENQEKIQIDFFKYIQWELDYQFKKIKEKLKQNNIMLFGDMPFMVNQESADAWSRQYDFRFDLELGAPPDAFSKEGQKWGIPAPNWDLQIHNNFEWWRLKLKKFEELYDIFRIDHLVGFFRTWVIPKDPNRKPDFDILDPLEQENRGRLFLKTITSSTKMYAVAEDLGVIPDFVRRVLKELNIAGYKVVRWEKTKDQKDYIEPEKYDYVSLATLSTHDTEPMNTWWKIIEEKEKKDFCRMIYKKDIKKIPKNYKDIKNAVLEKVINSNSVFVILSLQDIIASNERINTPGTTGTHNWSYRIKQSTQSFHKKYIKDFDFIKEKIKQRMK